MTHYKILKSFKGSQTGLDHHHFEMGTEAHLSSDLATIAKARGWATEIGAVTIKTSNASDHAAAIPSPDQESSGEPEEKAVKQAPANKAKKAAPENKGQ